LAIQPLRLLRRSLQPRAVAPECATLDELVTCQSVRRVCAERRLSFTGDPAQLVPHQRHSGCGREYFVRPRDRPQLPWRFPAGVPPVRQIRSHRESGAH
jgi:hypothetical protein